MGSPNHAYYGLRTNKAKKPSGQRDEMSGRVRGSSSEVWSLYIAISQPSGFDLCGDLAMLEPGRGVGSTQRRLKTVLVFRWFRENSIMRGESQRLRVTSVLSSVTRATNGDGGSRNYVSARRSSERRYTALTLRTPGHTCDVRFRDQPHPHQVSLRATS